MKWLKKEALFAYWQILLACVLSATLAVLVAWMFNT